MLLMNLSRKKNPLKMGMFQQKTFQMMNQLAIGNKTVEAKMQNPPQMATVHRSLETENENLASKKKRKLDASDNNGDRKKIGGDASGELGNGEVIQVETAEARELQLTSPAHVSTFRGAD